MIVRLIKYLRYNILDCQTALKDTQQYDYWFGRYTVFRQILNYIFRGGD
jgi:hypothetical protein